MYRFDYCIDCSKLFQLNDIKCSNCGTERFKKNKKEIDFKMQKYFLMSDLREIVNERFCNQIFCELLMKTLPLRQINTSQFISDIYDGDMYQKFIQKRNFRKTESNFFFF